MRGVSRLTSGNVPSPLKLLNPAAPGECCHLVLSNYGGGFLQGDRMALEVECGAGSRLLLGSQANTRIYRSQGEAAGLTLDGRLEDGALAVAMPDPVVPHAGSRFRQRQHWKLAATARLVLVETLIAGRLGTGERFAFEDFDSEVRITVAGRLVLVDRLAIDPARLDPSAPGAFGEHGASMTVYLAGMGLEEPARALETTAMEGAAAREGRLICGCAPFKDAGWVFRAVGATREELDPLIWRLGETVGEPSLLGFNPLSRRW